jgi:hypothetical protein
MGWSDYLALKMEGAWHADIKRLDALCLARAKFCRARWSTPEYLFVIKLNLSLQANSFIASFRRRLSLPDSRASVMPVCATFGGACNICEYLLDPFAHLLFSQNHHPNDDNYYNYVFFSQQIRPWRRLSVRAAVAGSLYTCQ